MKILLATDGSAAALEAARWLCRLQSSDRMSVTVLTVSYDPSQSSHGNIQPWFPEWNERERAQVQKHHFELEQLFADRFANLTKLHRHGTTVRTILDVAGEIDADVIVMGAVGHSMIARMLLGSVSDEVAVSADCSVLIVRPSQSETRASEATKITVAYDDSAESQHAIDELLQIPWIDSPQVDVLTIAPQFDYFMGDGLSPIVLENEQQIFQHMQQTGSKVSQRISATLPHVESHTVRGSHVGDSIVHHATEQHSDLILIGNRSHGALHNILLGSTTKYVLRHAPCSVWVSRR